MKTGLAKLLYLKGQREGMKRLHNYKERMCVCVQVVWVQVLCDGGVEYECEYVITVWLLRVCACVKKHVGVIS